MRQKNGHQWVASIHQEFLIEEPQETLELSFSIIVTQKMKEIHMKGRIFLFDLMNLFDTNCIYRNTKL